MVSSLALAEPAAANGKLECRTVRTRTQEPSLSTNDWRGRADRSRQPRQLESD